MSGIILIQVLSICWLILFGVVVGVLATKYNREINSFFDNVEDRIRKEVTHRELFMSMFYTLLVVLFCGFLILPLAVVGAVQISITDPRMHFLLVVVMNTVPWIFLSAVFFMCVCLLIGTCVGRRKECNSRCNKRKKDNL